MALIFSSIFVDLGAVLVALLWLTYWYFNRNFDYWKIRGVPYVKPQVFFGNIKDVVLLRRSSGVVFQDLYNELRNHKYGGIFQLMHPTILLRDPDIIKTVLVKDFPNFQDRGFRVYAKANPLADHLIMLRGWKWRALRAKLTPTFTSGKMKMMFHVIEESARRLQEVLSEPAGRGEVLELKEVLANFSTDIIGSCAFGLQMNAMDNPNSEFRKMGKKVFESTMSNALRSVLSLFLPGIVRVLKISSISPEVTEFFLRVVKDTVLYRQKNNIKRNDFLQLLIEIKNKGNIDDEHVEKEGTDELSEKYLHKSPGERPLEMDDALMAAQAFVFFLAGFETSSTAMSFTLYELALNPDIQTKLREEIDETLKETDGKLTYDSVLNMKYMDKVVSESLRKYPPVGNLFREVTGPYTLPNENAKVDIGTRIVIPVFALHHDPKYFPNPERFDPERFNEEEKAKRPHYVYMPFGEGPRNCIAIRFGLLQTKMGLTALLAKYEFHVCDRTEIPIRFDPKSRVTASSTGTILRITNRSSSNA